MSRVNRYLLSNFWASIAPLFLTLFSIMSVVFFIQISRVTSVIEIDFYELGKLYMYSLPQVLLYTFSISYFIALTLVMFKLSKENEIIVLFSLGYSPVKVAKFFSSISLLVTIILIFNALVLLPMASQLNRNFIEFKKSNANLTLKPAEFGQKFSNWLVFIEDEKENEEYQEYQNVMMFSVATKDTNERIIISQSAKIDNEQSQMSLVLDSGYLYDLSKDKFNETSFDKLTMNSYSNAGTTDVVGIVEYWSNLLENSKKSSSFAVDMLVSLLPISTTLFALAFGIVTYRYQRKGIYFELFLVLLLYFGAMSLLNKALPLPSIAIIFFSSITASLWFFRKNIIKRY